MKSSTRNTIPRIFDKVYLDRIRVMRRLRINIVCDEQENKIRKFIRYGIKRQLVVVEELVETIDN